MTTLIKFLLTIFIIMYVTVLSLILFPFTLVNNIFEQVDKMGELVDEKLK